MGLLDCASSASLWRGYDYYKASKVRNLRKTGDKSYVADVIGTSNVPYIVEIDAIHPRKSKCNCPHADGKRIVCKHQVAVYFSAFPNEAVRFYNECIVSAEMEEQRQEELADKVIAYVYSMKKSEVCQALLTLLFDGPEWQYDCFVREHDLDEY